ncbi:hypothetical protein KI387_044311, partial [Taxus chinensis]
NELGTKLYKKFEDKNYHLSLVEQFNTIKRPPQEYMSDFNLRFEKNLEMDPNARK